MANVKIAVTAFKKLTRLTDAFVDTGKHTYGDLAIKHGLKRLERSLATNVTALTDAEFQEYMTVTEAWRQNR